MVVYVSCAYRVPLEGIGHYLPLASGGLCPGRGNAGWRGKGKECVARLVARLSFFDGQGEQVTVRCEIEDDVAAVGFDGVEQGRFVEPITGHDIGLRLDQEADGLKVAEPGGMDERSAAVGIAWVNGGAVLEQAGDTLTMLAVQWGGGGPLLPGQFTLAPWAMAALSRGRFPCRTAWRNC